MTKRLISFVLLIGFTSTFAVAQYSQGIVHEGLTMKSDILGQDVSYTVYLPSDYETSQRYYPVVYLLHGHSDDDTGWLQFGEANRIADQAIAQGVAPLISWTERAHHNQAAGSSARRFRA